MPDSANGIRILVLDVDGVMTDGGIHIDDHGVETKRFHVRDGCGLRVWRRLGFETAVITGRSGMAIRHRVNELGIRHVVQGSGDKGSALAKLLEELEIEPRCAAVLADDLPDLPMMLLAGYPMAVSDACREARERAKFITVRPGGHGAVREAIEHLIKAQDRWGEALALFGITDAADD